VTTIQLQNAFVATLARFLTSPWDIVKVRYENYEVGKNNRREIFQADYEIGGDRTSIRLSLEALDILEELQQHRPEGQAESWTWLEFALDSAGRYRFEYKYGVPPLIAEQIRYS